MREPMISSQTEGYTFKSPGIGATVGSGLWYIGSLHGRQ
jgi:hypothetical protein